jgi:hypothetical protein
MSVSSQSVVGGASKFPSEQHCSLTSEPNEIAIVDDFIKSSGFRDSCKEIQCTICYCKRFSIALITKECKHYGCERCFSKAFQIKSSCPICRKAPCTLENVKISKIMKDAQELMSIMLLRPGHGNGNFMGIERLNIYLEGSSDLVLHVFKHVHGKMENIRKILILAILSYNRVLDLWIEYINVFFQNVGLNKSPNF